MNEQSFLGRGWAFPPRFSSSGAQVTMVSGVDDIHESLQILLSTRLGERVMNEDFGCDLSAMLFDEVDQTFINEVTGIVENAIIYHEPRIKMDALQIDTSDADAGLLLISILYTVRATNSRYNMVYPFYINEAMR